MASNIHVRCRLTRASVALGLAFGCAIPVSGAWEGAPYAVAQGPQSQGYYGQGQGQGQGFYGQGQGQGQGFYGQGQGQDQGYYGQGQGPDQGYYGQGRGSDQGYYGQGQDQGYYGQGRGQGYYGQGQGLGPGQDQGYYGQGREAPNFSEFPPSGAAPVYRGGPYPEEPQAGRGGDGGGNPWLPDNRWQQGGRAGTHPGGSRRPWGELPTNGGGSPPQRYVYPEPNAAEGGNKRDRVKERDWSQPAPSYPGASPYYYPYDPLAPGPGVWPGAGGYPGSGWDSGLPYGLSPWGW